MLADDQEVELQGIDGILVYKDFSDPKLFYCSSTRPSVARKDDGYQFTIVLYDPPRDDCAGMLSFVVDLKLDAGEEAEGRDPVARQDPRRATRRDAVERGHGRGRDHRRRTGLRRSLADREQFRGIGRGIDDGSVSAAEEQRQESASSPDFDRLQPLLSRRSGRNTGSPSNSTKRGFANGCRKKPRPTFLVVSFEKVETFEDLRQSGVIRVVSENETGETPPEGFQRAFLSSMQSLLEPAPRFGTPPGASGNSWLIGFSSSTVRDIQNISRRLDRNMKVSGAVSRKIFIQGGLDGLDDAMAAEPVVFPTDNPFVQKLKVRCHAAFDAAPLLAANVTVKPRNVAVPLTRVFNKIAARRMADRARPRSRRRLGNLLSVRIVFRWQSREEHVAVDRDPARAGVPRYRAGRVLRLSPLFGQRGGGIPLEPGEFDQAEAQGPGAALLRPGHPDPRVPRFDPAGSAAFCVPVGEAGRCGIHRDLPASLRRALCA